MLAALVLAATDSARAKALLRHRGKLDAIGGPFGLMAVPVVMAAPQHWISLFRSPHPDALPVRYRLVRRLAAQRGHLAAKACHLDAQFG